MSYDDLDDDLELDLGASIPTVSFNRVAVRKPFNESIQEDVTKQVLEQKKRLALDTRCSECGSIKQQRKEGKGKFRLVCTTCKKNKRTQTAREKRENEARST